MQGRNEYWAYWLATQFTPLRHIAAGQTRVDAVVITFAAQRAVTSIVENRFAGLELCYEQVMGLKQMIESISITPETLSTEITHYDVARVKEALNAFETALSIQFTQVNTYRVTTKGTHDVRKLIETPEEAFGKYWLGMTESSQRDWQAGAKCLAFELPTACGFHVVRAMEATVVNYLNRLGIIPDKRDLGHYVDLLRKADASEAATDIVEQIRKHHRNPLMHPEDTLDVPMAMSLYDLCRAAIVELVSDMENRGFVSLQGGEQGSLLEALPMPELESHELSSQ